MASSTKKEKPGEIDLLPLLKVAWKLFCKSWMVCVLIVAITSGIGFLNANRVYTPYYKATATYLVTSKNNATNNTVLKQRTVNRLTATQLSETFPYILRSGVLQRVVAADLGVQSIPGYISASMLGETNIIEINVTGVNAEACYEVLQSVVKNYPEVAQYIIGGTNLTLVEDSGVPTEPYNKKTYKRTIMLFVLGGLAIYLLALALWTLSRRTISSYSDLEKYINVRYLGGLPEVVFKRRSTRRTNDLLIDNEKVPDSYAESMESLELRVTRYMESHHMRSVFFTSALAGEGKTTTACNVALMMARKGHRVLLIDGDLRNPSVLENLFGEVYMKPGKKKKNANAVQNEYPEGLVDYLEGKVSLQNILRQYKNESLYVIPGGKPVGKASSYYGSERFRYLLSEYADRYEYVVVDTPPCSFMNDTSLIVRRIDTGVLVIRQDYAPLERILASIEILFQSHVKLAGVTINDADRSGGNYGYGYGHYDYGKYAYGKYGYGKYSKSGYGKYGAQSKRG